MLWFRAVAFHVGFILSTALWGTSLTIIALCMPRRGRFRAVIVPWVTFVLWWLRITCGVKVEVQGSEHLLSGTGILFMKHSSTWDALFSQLLVCPQTTVIKKNLLWIPCFGWAFWVTGPITIDRSQPLSALRQMIDQGKTRLADDIWVCLFPEGTRVQPGKVGKFQIGGARLAKESGAPAYFVAHNGGLFWRQGEIPKRPGTIQLRISPPQYVGNDSAEAFNARAEDWMNQQMAELDPPVGIAR